MKIILTIWDKSHIIITERYKMNEYNTIFYETVDGKIPAKEFLLRSRKLIWKRHTGLIIMPETSRDDYIKRFY